VPLISLSTSESTALQRQKVDARQHELGQFFTPVSVAEFMASLFGHFAEIRLLDAGAGTGALTLAAVQRYCTQDRKPHHISVTAYEVDSEVIPQLRDTLTECERICKRSGVQFTSTLHAADFIESVVPLVRGDLFAPLCPKFNAAIINPPYRKIRSDSSVRKQLRSAGIETSNLYTAFIALVARLLGENAELVAITPRSFCNGPYFRPFREDLLSTMSLRRLHVFESRSAVFKDSDVLQENIIFHAVKSQRAPRHIIVSTSIGTGSQSIKCRKLRFSDVVSPHDADKFIHLITSEKDAEVREMLSGLTASLMDLGISVSTGRVVDFRAKAFLRDSPSIDSVPLIYPCHFNGGVVHWPKSGRKPNAIISNDSTADLLVPSGIYVLVKRFTTKEERRRIVACIYDPEHIRSSFVGFENHLNYFHIRGEGLELTFAKGLAAFLNSSVVDIFFRQFNGHTQVNATDLRSLKYPSRQQLLSIGQALGTCLTDQDHIDAVVEKELNVATKVSQ
jgi:adenine-specific DNA-methyltransferase